MPLYIAPYIGAGTRKDPFRPLGSDQPGWASIDLRGNPTKIDGAALLRLAIHDPILDAYRIADDRSELLGTASKSRILNSLGIDDVSVIDPVTLVRYVFLGPQRRGLCLPIPWSQLGEREIWLGGDRWHREAGGPAHPVVVDPTDDFNRADQSPIAGNWTAVPGSSQDIQLISNQVAGTSSGDAAIYWNADTPPNDQYSQLVLAVTGSDADCGPAVRADTAAFSFYWFALFAPGPAFNKFVAGSFTSIAGITASITAGDTYRIEAEGTTLRAKKNGASVTGSPTTDSSLAAGRWGIFIFEGSAGGLRVDNWQGGSIPEAVADDRVDQALDEGFITEYYDVGLFQSEQVDDATPPDIVESPDTYQVYEPPFDLYVDIPPDDPPPPPDITQWLESFYEIEPYYDVGVFESVYDPELPEATLEARFEADVLYDPGYVEAPTEAPPVADLTEISLSIESFYELGAYYDVGIFDDYQFVDPPPPEPEPEPEPEPPTVKPRKPMRVRVVHMRRPYGGFNTDYVIDDE